MKVETYAANWGGEHILREDVARLSAAVLPGKVDLAWAAFPCQDLSLAGDYAGLGREWRLPTPPSRTHAFSDLVEDQPRSVRWHTPSETARLIELMSPVNRAKLESAKRARRRAVGTLYKRTRQDPDGAKRQRAEVRFDEIAGCLRTPRGGSSRQTIILVDGEKVRSRLLSPREAARLMGLDDGYRLPERYNDAYHVAGDAVCVPAVRHIAACLLEPILRFRNEELRPLAAE